MSLWRALLAKLRPVTQPVAQVICTVTAPLVPREIVIPKLPPPKNWLAGEFPSHPNFWDKVTDPVVVTPLKYLSQIGSLYWPINRAGGGTRLYLPLSHEWIIWETDECLEFTDLTFVFNGKPMFKVHTSYSNGWGWNTAHDLHDIFATELRDLITAKVAEYQRLCIELGHSDVYRDPKPFPIKP